MQLTGVPTTFVRTSHGTIALADSGGTGPAVVFIHGNSLRKETFALQFPALRGKYRAISIDLPGHGETSDATDPARTYTSTGYAACIAEVLSDIGVGQALVVGWSLGAFVGFELTESFDGLAGLLAIGAPPIVVANDGTLAGYRPHPKAHLSGQAKFSRDEARDYAAAIADLETVDDWWTDTVMRTDGRARTTLFEGIFATLPRRQRDLVESFPGPLCMLLGSEDPFVDADYVKRINYRNLWRGAVQVIDGVGHAPHLHAPERFNALLTDLANDVFR